MSENTPENVSSELVDLGEFDYQGFDPEMVNSALVNNISKVVKHLISEAAADSIGLAMMRAFKLDPAPADYEKVLTKLMHVNSIVQDMMHILEKIVPFESGFKDDQVSLRKLRELIDNHPYMLEAKERIQETADQKLARVLKNDKVRFPHNG